MTKKIYKFTVYEIGQLDFDGYPDLTKSIFFENIGNKECRFLKTPNGVGIIIDEVLAWAIGLRVGISQDKSICFYKKNDKFYLGFRNENNT